MAQLTSILSKQPGQVAPSVPAAVVEARLRPRPAPTSLAGWGRRREQPARRLSAGRARASGRGGGRSRSRRDGGTRPRAQLRRRRAQRRRPGAGPAQARSLPRLRRGDRHPDLRGRGEPRRDHSQLRPPWLVPDDHAGDQVRDRRRLHRQRRARQGPPRAGLLQRLGRRADRAAGQRRDRRCQSRDQQRSCFGGRSAGWGSSASC